MYDGCSPCFFYWSFFIESRIPLCLTAARLTDLEYRILYLMASHPRKIFSAQNIYESIWNEPYFYSSNNLVVVHIRNIRRKLGDDPQNCHTIRTVWGKGYRIE